MAHSAGTGPRAADALKHQAHEMAEAGSRLRPDEPLLNQA